MPTSSSGKISVLLVEDDEASRYALRRNLEHLGMRVVEATTAAEAIDQLSHPFDCVVLDWVIPGSGREVVKHLRRTADPTLIAVVSAGDMEVTREVADYYPDAFFAKPLSAEVFAEWLVSERSRARQLVVNC